MAVTINASTTSGLVMTSDLSGVLTLQQNGVSLPNGGVAPAFSANTVTAQSFSNSTFTKVQYNVKVFDTNSNYDPTTNYRFTPTVAGYYQISGAIGVTSAITGSIGLALAIQKNGSQIGQTIGTASSSFPGPAVSRLVYLNGSTDYIELYVYTNAGNITLQGGTSFTFFTGALVRAA